MTVLAEPNFVERNPEQIEREVFDTWFGLTGVALTPNQPEWMVLKAIAYRETLSRIKIQEAAKLNLLRFTRFPMIDYLGELIGVPRLDEKFATTTLRFSIDDALGEDTLVPSGTRGRSQNSVAVFASDANATIAAGNTFVDVAATATSAGTASNGYLVSQIAVMVDDLPGVSVENLMTTKGGAAAEDDVRYLERILLGPDSFSTAGSEAGYRFHALSVSQLIEDVAVLSDEPLSIRVILLNDDGSVTPELIEAVETKLSATDKRPQNDQVTVEASGVVDWEIEAELTIFANADAETTLVAAQLAADAYAASRRKLGRAALVEQVRVRLAVPGVYSVALAAPILDTLPAPDAWARCTAITVSIAGVVEEKDD